MAISNNGKPLQIEPLDVVLKQVTFNTKHLQLWPNIYEGYELIDLHGKMKVGTMSHDEKDAIFDMLLALANVCIIRDAVQVGAERMYVDARPWTDND